MNSTKLSFWYRQLLLMILPFTCLIQVFMQLLKRVLEMREGGNRKCAVRSGSTGRNRAIYLIFILITPSP